MSQVPATPQAPVAPVVLPPPPNVSLNDIIGGPPAAHIPPSPGAFVPAMSGAEAVAAAQARVTPVRTAPATPATPATPAAPTSKLGELSQFFGVTETDPVKATAALRPVLDLLAKGGHQQPAPVQQVAPVQQPAPAAAVQTPVTPAEPASFADLDLGEDASPEIVKAFKSLASQSEKAILAANAQAETAQKMATATHEAYELQQKQANMDEQQQVANQAIGYLDTLASPKYGVGNNRNFVQQLAAEQVMTTAGKMLRGMKAYGQVLPIEDVVSTAILLIDGVLPTPAAPAAAAPVAAFSPVAATGQVVAPAVQNVGSSGAGGSMMADPEFMAGARAILARQ